jgi:tripartite-type tricarboxylate transporter receptor subunit TctC
VVVKNVPGGGGRLGAREFAQKPADGQTLGYMVDQGLYVTQLLGQAEGYDMNTWQWVAGIRQSPQAVMVGRDSPFKSIHDIIAADKAGQRLRMGHNGLGNGFLISDLIFIKALGIQNYVLVGGFGGTADMVPALTRGDLDVNVLGPIASNIGFIQSGDLRPLMMVTKDRNPLIPNVPTAAEENVPGVAELNEAGSSTGFVVVGGTPPEIVKVLEAATLAAVKDPGFLEWAKTSGVADDLIALPGAEMTARKEREYAVYRKYLDDIAKYQ